MKTEYIIDRRHWVGPGVEALEDMLKAKEKGARNERKVRDQLLADGWWVAKAGGSLGLWDLVALHPDGAVRVVQVKSNRQPDPEERKKLEAFDLKFTSVQCFIALVRDRKPTIWRLVGGEVQPDSSDSQSDD